MRGGELRQIRNRLGMSQARLATEVGVDSNTIARWERDEVPIGATAEILIKRLDSQRRRSPDSAKSGHVTRDEHHQQILLALEGHLDPEIFERCAVDLIGKTRVRVVPVAGGGDGGFDGSVVNLESGRPIPLVVTTSARPADNLKASVRSAKRQDPTLDRAFFATSRSLTPQTRRRLGQVAAQDGIQLMQVYDRAWFAQALYRDPAWCKKLLNLTGRPRALSQYPMGSRTIQGQFLVGRGEAIEWLKGHVDDCLLMGVPGSGKTFLLQSLAEELNALFLVEDDRERIANDIRELSPEVVIVDDAHTNIGALRSLNQLRAEIGADELRIIATTWPGYASEVAKELALPASAKHELGPIHADDMIEVIKAHGITGPDRLLALIRQQARGKPGLAGTLAALSLAGDTRRILSGEALLEQLAPPLISMLGEDAIALLAHFALGGNSGADPEFFAARTGETSIKVQSQLAKLAAAGIIHPLSDGRIVIVPEALRIALVRSVFLGQTGPSYRQALDWVANRHDGIVTLIRASTRGTPLSGLLGLLQQANSDSLWAEYAKLGEREALHVIKNGLSRYDLVAEQGFHYVPDVMIPLILDELPEPWPLFGAENHPAVRALREWTVSRGDGFPRDEVLIRRKFVEATRAWWDRSGRTHQALYALSLALKPTYSIHALDPGAGTSLTVTSFILHDSVRAAQKNLWADVLDLVKQAKFVPWEELLSLAVAWHQTKGVPEQVAVEMRRFSEEIMADLASVTKEHPGIQSILGHRGKVWGVEIDVVLDPHYEAAFPRGGPFTTEEDEKRAARFVNMVVELSPSVIADKLVYISRERSYAGNSSDGFVFQFACQQLASLVPDLVAFIEKLMERGAERELVSHFFTQAARVGQQGLGDLISRFLDNPDYEPVAVHYLLVDKDTPSPSLSDALERADHYPFMLLSLAEFGQLNSEATHRLLTGPDEGLASRVAAGYHLKGHAKESDINYEVWRDAVVRSARTVDLGDGQSGWSIKEILKKDPELARDWLLERISADKHWLDLHDDCAEIAAGMTLEQRRFILERIEDRPVIGTENIVRQLVGDDLELLAQALRMDNLSNYRAAMLAGRPSDMWLKKAIIAMEAGLKSVEIAESAIPTEMGWWGAESRMWAGWRLEFEELTGREIEDPRVDRLLQTVIDSIWKREEAAKGREAKENVLGLGER